VCKKRLRNKIKRRNSLKMGIGPKPGIMKPILGILRKNSPWLGFNLPDNWDLNFKSF